MSGFLVVLASIADSGGRTYAGVNRVPPYYPGALGTEADAMEEYVLGDVKDFDSNLIPSFEKALHVCRRLSRGGRKFEVIYCGYANAESLPADLRIRSAHSLGYDVAAVRGDYWSIVFDLPKAGWAQAFRESLNENGLFPNRRDAETYLLAYRTHEGPDHDVPFDVVSVSRVVPR